MRTAKPRVIGQTGLLWGDAVGTIDLCEVLGEYDATLQFLGARVGALREIDDGTLFPPTAPMAERSLVILVVFEGRDLWTGREILCGKGQDIIGCGKLKVVAVALLEGGVAFPLKENVVSGVVEGSLDKC